VVFALFAPHFAPVFAPFFTAFFTAWTGGLHTGTCIFRVMVVNWGTCGRSSLWLLEVSSAMHAICYLTLTLGAFGEPVGLVRSR
jgi:hypothetical protein